MKTYQPKEKDVKRNWHLVDVKGKVLGRVSSEIAQLLIGKHKPSYSRHMDMGDNVVVINAKDVALTGNKPNKKVYRKHSGYPGGFKEIPFKKMLEIKPEEVIKIAVSGMLPDNRLKKERLKRLKIFAASRHSYGDRMETQ